MDRNRINLAGARRTHGHGGARRPLSDEQLEALAVAFGSHLIRNAPPQRALGALLSNRKVKITGE